MGQTFLSVKQHIWGEVILFPKTYQKYGHLLTSHGPYIITGRVQHEDFNTTLIADKIEPATNRHLTKRLD